MPNASSSYNEAMSISVPVFRVPWTVLQFDQRVSSSVAKTYDRDLCTRQAVRFTVDAFADEILAVAAKWVCGIANRWIAISWRPAIYRQSTSYSGDILSFELVFAIVNPTASVPTTSTAIGVVSKNEPFSKCRSWTFGTYAFDGCWNPAQSPIGGPDYSSKLGLRPPASYSEFRTNPRRIPEIWAGENRPILFMLSPRSLAEAVSKSASDSAYVWLKHGYRSAIANLLRQSFLGFESNAIAIANEHTPVVVFALTDLSWVAKPMVGCAPSLVKRALFYLFPQEMSVGFMDVLAHCSIHKSKAIQIILHPSASSTSSTMFHDDSAQGEPHMVPEFNCVNHGLTRVSEDGFLHEDRPFSRATKITRKSILDTLDAAED